MTKIENREQYDWAVARVEQLLPLVDDNTHAQILPALSWSCCQTW